MGMARKLLMQQLSCLPDSLKVSSQRSACNVNIGWWGYCVQQLENGGAGRLYRIAIPRQVSHPAVVSSSARAGPTHTQNTTEWSDTSGQRYTASAREPVTTCSGTSMYSWQTCVAGLNRLQHLHVEHNIKCHRQARKQLQLSCFRASSRAKIKYC